MEAGRSVTLSKSVRASAREVVEADEIVKQQGVDWDLVVTVLESPRARDQFKRQLEDLGRVLLNFESIVNSADARRRALARIPQIANPVDQLLSTMDPLLWPLTARDTWIIFHREHFVPSLLVTLAHDIAGWGEAKMHLTLPQQLLAKEFNSAFSDCRFGRCDVICKNGVGSQIVQQLHDKLVRFAEEISGIPRLCTIEILPNGGDVTFFVNGESPSFKLSKGEMRGLIILAILGNIQNIELAKFHVLNGGSGSASHDFEQAFTKLKGKIPGFGWLDVKRGAKTRSIQGIELRSTIDSKVLRLILKQSYTS